MLKDHQRSVTITMTKAEYARAETVAEREDRSVSSLLRVALKDYCDRAEGVTTTQHRTQDHGAADSWPRNPFDQHGRKT